MGMQPIGVERQYTTEHTPNNYKDWAGLYRLLDDANYDEAATHFQQILTTSNQYNNPALEPLLSAAQQLCSLCRQYKIEVSRYQQAYAEASAREEELRGQLTAVLDQVTQLVEPDLSRREAAIEKKGNEPDVKVDHGRTLWQRVQALWKKKIGFQQSRLPIVIVNQEEEDTAVLSPGKKPPEITPSSFLAIFCLGLFRVYQNDQLISEWNGLKGQMVLKYLITYKEKPTPKDALMDRFWPECNPDAARRNLHQAIYSLRQALKSGDPGFQHIVFENGCYFLNPELGVWIDYEEFYKHAKAGQRLEAIGQHAEAMTQFGIAEGLYQGDFLEEDVYEEYYKLQRQQLRNTYFNITNWLSEHYIRQHEYPAAVALCQKMLTYDNCFEAAHRRLMRAYLAQHQRHLAIRQFQFCQDVLKTELEVSPSEKTVSLYRRITA